MAPEGCFHTKRFPRFYKDMTNNNESEFLKYETTNINKKLNKYISYKFT